MRLFLGVCKGLQALHQHRLKEPGTRVGGGVEGAEEEGAQPLMSSEVRSQREGGQEGDIRAYAHRDIKPG